MTIQIKREHEICMGHRVHGHESKCSNLHGHNYKFEFTVRPKISLDSIGRVVDYSEIKSVLCEWLENNWDHKTLLFNQDPLAHLFSEDCYDSTYYDLAVNSIVEVPFNPTAENIAYYFLNVVAKELTMDKNWYLYAVNLYETSKCSAYVCLNSSTEKIIQELRPLVPMPNSYCCSLQWGTMRDCVCKDKSDEEKINCRYCVTELPF